jgi:hypothetical protein
MQIVSTGTGKKQQNFKDKLNVNFNENKVSFTHFLQYSNYLTFYIFYSYRYVPDTGTVFAVYRYPANSKAGNRIFKHSATHYPVTTVPYIISVQSYFA